MILFHHNKFPSKQPISTILQNYQNINVLHKHFYLIQPKKIYNLSVYHKRFWGITRNAFSPVLTFTTGILRGHWIRIYFFLLFHFEFALSCWYYFLLFIIMDKKNLLKGKRPLSPFDQKDHKFGRFVLFCISNKMCLSGS